MTAKIRRIGKLLEGGEVEYGFEPAGTPGLAPGCINYYVAAVRRQGSTFIVDLPEPVSEGSFGLSLNEAGETVFTFEKYIADRIADGERVNLSPVPTD